MKKVKGANKVIADMENFTVESIYGLKTKQGLVTIGIHGKEMQYTILDAKKMAYIILEACEGAQTDEYLMEFFIEELKQPLDIAGAMLLQMRMMRKKNDPHFFEN